MFLKMRYGGLCSRPPEEQKDTTSYQLAGWSTARQKLGRRVVGRADQTAFKAVC